MKKNYTTTKTILLTAICMFAFAFLKAQTVNVTLSVDLNFVSDLEPGGAVWFLEDSGWNEYDEMTDGDGDGIYTYTIEQTTGTTFTYRFSYQNGPDPINDYVEENVPDQCSNDDGFRELLVPGTDETLPVFAFGSCDDNPNLKVNITFQVDMSQETNPNDVQVVIKNPWIWTTLTDQGGGVWSASVEVDANNTYPYTFVNGGQDNWDEEESVPEPCNFGTPTAPERHIEVAEMDTIVELVSFGSCMLISSVKEGQLLKMKIFPNPTDRSLTVDLGDTYPNVRMEITDVSGKLVLSKEFDQTSLIEVDLDTPAGIYFLNLTSDDNKATYKLVKH